MKTKSISQQVKVNATLPPLVGSVSVRISLEVIPGGVHVAIWMMNSLNIFMRMSNYLQLLNKDKSIKVGEKA